AENGCESQLASDGANCGACGATCGAGQVCLNGGCVSPAGTPTGTPGRGPVLAPLTIFEPLGRLKGAGVIGGSPGGVGPRVGGPGGPGWRAAVLRAVGPPAPRPPPPPRARAPPSPPPPPAGNRPPPLFNAIAFVVVP